RVACEPVQQVAVLAVEAQRAGERGRHLRRRRRGAALLEPGEVVGGDAGEPGELLAAQARGAAAGTRGSPTASGVTASRRRRTMRPNSRVSTAPVRADRGRLSWPCCSYDLPVLRSAGPTISCPPTTGRLPARP